jgi:type IV secretory pathway VirB10-like protein
MIFYNLVKDADLDQLCELGAVTAKSVQAQAVTAAFQRLQTKAMQDAAKAQIEAAEGQKKAAQALAETADEQQESTKALIDTATHTRTSALWLMISTFVLAASTVINVIVTIWDHYH